MSMLTPESIPNFQGKIVPTGIQDLNTVNYNGSTTADVSIKEGDKYEINITGDVASYKPEETPLNTLVANLGTESDQRYFFWNDEYEGEMWDDIMLDHFRLQDDLVIGTETVTISGAGSSTAFKVGGQTGDYQAYITHKPVDIENASYTGGMLKYFPLKMLGTNVYTNSSSTYAVAESATILSQIMTESTYNIIPIDYNNDIAFALTTATATLTESGDVGIKTTIGNATPMIGKLRSLGQLYKYTKKVDTGSNWEAYKFDSTQGKPILFVMFDDLPIYYNEDGTLDTVEVKHQVLAQVKEFGFDTGYATVYFKLGLGTSCSNVELPVTHGTVTGTASSGMYGINSNVLASGAGTSTVQAVVTLESSAKIAGTVFSTNWFGRMVRNVLAMANLSVPRPYPDFDRTGRAGNVVTYRERKGSMTQIFKSDAYGISGGDQASKFRFGDDFARTRGKHLSMYKQGQEAAFLMGIKYRGIATNTNDPLVDGQEVRATGGLLDYALYPIKYMRATMPTVGGSEAYAGEKLMKFIDDLLDSLTAFRQKGAKSFNFLVPQNVLRKLSVLNALYYGSPITSTTIAGAHTMQNKPSGSISFGFKEFSYEGVNGTVNFIHEPLFDLLPYLPVPYHIYKANLNPRNMMLHIDTANLKKVTFRPDRIFGNIQEHDRDGFLEYMMGEHGFKCRFPRNHAIIKLD